MPGRYGVPSNYHITLAFLGEVAPERLPDAQAILAGHIAQMPAPTITLGPVDFFGRAENAILILRALCNPPLDTLHNALAADARFAADAALASRHAFLAAQAGNVAAVDPMRDGVAASGAAGTYPADRASYAKD